MFPNRVQFLFLICSFLGESFVFNFHGIAWDCAQKHVPAALSSVVLQSFGEYLISVTDFPWSAAIAIKSGIYIRWLAAKSACQARHIWVTVARGSPEYSAESIQTTHRHQSVFRVGSALRRTISVLFRNIVLFGILAVVFILPIHFLPSILGFLAIYTLN